MKNTNEKKLKIVIYKEVRDFVNNIISISISQLREGYKK